MGEESRPPVGRATVVRMLVVGLVASALGIALGLAIDWFPTQASTQGEQIDTFWDVLIIVSVPIFVLVTTVVLFSAFRFRQRKGEEGLDGPPIHGNTRLEVVWTAIPAVILVGLCTYAFVVLTDIEEAPAAQERVVVVTGQQFAWTFTYPGAGADGKDLSANQLFLPVDQPVRFQVRTKDVLHDFWVPEFRMKIDAVPGITTKLRVTPTKVGVYPVVCAELCGLGHAYMRQSAHVVSPEDFEAWLEKTRTPVTQPTGEGGAVDAKAIFAEGNAAGSTACGACHQLADAGTPKGVGPNLDEVTQGLGEAGLREAIVDPEKDITAGFPAGVMPANYGDVLSAEELDALVTYLLEVTK